MNLIRAKELEKRYIPSRGVWRGVVYMLPVPVPREPACYHYLQTDTPGHVRVVSNRAGVGEQDLMLVELEVPPQHLVTLDRDGHLRLLPRSDDAGRAAGTIVPFSQTELEAWQKSMTIDPQRLADSRNAGYRDLSELEVDGRASEPTNAEFALLEAAVQAPLPEDYLAFVRAINGGCPLRSYSPKADFDLEEFYAVSGELQMDSIRHILAEAGVPVVPIAHNGGGDSLVYGRKRGKWVVQIFRHEDGALEPAAKSLVAFVKTLEAP